MARKHDEEEGVQLTDEVGNGPRVYEAGFHLDPELASEEVKKAYGEIRENIVASGTLVAEVEPHNIPLAYTISRQETSGRRDFDSAYFAWIAYEATPEAHEGISSAIHADKRVIRALDVVTTKEAARHALEMHDIAEKTSDRTSGSEEDINEELDAALENVAV